MLSTVPAVQKIQTLADYLGTDAPVAPDPDGPRLEDIADSRAFAIAVLGSREFRTYIVSCLTLGTIPPALLMRMMDYAWGKPPDRIEHTGKDGAPIVTEVRRVIVRAPSLEYDEADQKSVTH